MTQETTFPFKSHPEVLRWANGGRQIASIRPDGRYVSASPLAMRIDADAEMTPSMGADILPLYFVHIEYAGRMKVEDLDRFARSILDFIHGGSGHVT